MSSSQESHHDIANLHRTLVEVDNRLLCQLIVQVVGEQFLSKSSWPGQLAMSLVEVHNRLPTACRWKQIRKQRWLLAFKKANQNTQAVKNERFLISTRETLCKFSAKVAFNKVTDWQTDKKTWKTINSYTVADRSWNASSLLKIEFGSHLKNNLWEFFRVRNVVLTRFRCAQPLCVYACIRMITYAR